MEEHKFAIAVTAILTLLPCIVHGAYTANSGPDLTDEHCVRSYEVNDKQIIRTEDSLENESSFVDAVVSESYQSCLRKCCEHGLEMCDTTVFIESDAGTDENCFLFRCWFGRDEQRCLFSYHEGYKSSMIGGFEAPRFSNLETFPVLVEDEGQDPKIQSTTVTPTTTRTPVAIQVPKKTTTLPVQPEYKVEHQQCISTQYQCPKSGECIPERLVCDQFEDCRDKSDERNCDAQVEDDGVDTAALSPSGHAPKTKADKYEPKYSDTLVPLSEEESVSYSEDSSHVPDSSKYHDSTLPEKLPEHPHHQTGDTDPAAGSSTEELGQQDIQHLRLLADKQKNKNDLLSMRHQAQEVVSDPAREHTKSDQPGRGKDEDVDDQGERCLLGICPPESEVPDGRKWRLEPGADFGNGRQVNDESSRRDEKLEDRIPEPLLQYDYLGSRERDPPPPHRIKPEQQSGIPAVTQGVSHSKAPKTHRVGPPGESGKHFSSQDGDSPDPRYMDRGLVMDRGRMDYHPPILVREEDAGDIQAQRGRGDKSKHTPSRGENGQRPDIPFDEQEPALSAPDRSAMKGARFESGLRDSDVGGESPDHERLTTDHPRGWLPSNDRKPINMQSPPVPSDILNPAVMDSDYFEEWPGISLLYDQDSYNVGGDWARLPPSNWQSDPLPPKGIPQRPGDDGGWFNRYGDNQYGYYEPRQRDRGRQRAPSRGRNRLRGGGAQQKAQGRYKGRDRGGYTDLDGVDDTRHYTSVHQEEPEEGYPVHSVDPEPPHQPEADIPDLGPPSTTTLPLPEPTQEAVVDDDAGGGITNRVTPPAESYPLPTNPLPVRYQGPADIKEPVLTEELEGASGAMFPLVMGLLLTLFLLVMVGFRLHYMNRRVRYGRMKTNAHDADYLINGMYL